MALPTPERIRFLYRMDQGRIDGATWVRGAGALAAILAPLTLIWLALRPHIVHDLSKSPLFAPEIFAAYAYALSYAFVLILIAASYVNLSAKRFRDRGRPAPLGLASLFPLAVLLVGAAHLAPILHPSVAETMPSWFVGSLDAALVVAALWTIVELGVLPSQAPRK